MYVGYVRCLGFTVFFCFFVGGNALVKSFNVMGNRCVQKKRCGDFLFMAFNIVLLDGDGFLVMILSKVYFELHF